MEWLACRVATGKEYLVRGKIRMIAPDAEILIPRMYSKEIQNGSVKTKSERILPGYLLIGTKTPIGELLSRGFVKVIGSVTEEEVALLRAQEGLKDENLTAGIRVLVIEGPFQGCKGTIEKDLGNGNMTCKLMFQGMEVNASIKSELLSSIK